VHLCAYPVADPAVVDEPLATEMRLARDLVSLGLQVRTDNKLRVRQPLAQADVVVASAELGERMAAYGELVAEELNVLAVRWLEPGAEGGAVRYELKPNFRSLGPKLGKKVQLVKQQLATANPSAIRTALASQGSVTLEVDGEPVTLTAEDVDVAVVAAEGYAAAGGRGGVVVLHTALSPALLDQGLAREILARVQSLRKELDLGYTESIELTVRGSERVRRVVEADRAHLAKEALCSSIRVEASSSSPPLPARVPERVELEVQDETIEIVVGRGAGA
jgi:isoleucyl-tRNA synthetase